MANLTTKELTALDDIMGVEQTLVKKYRAMASLCTDEQTRQQFQSIADKHLQHYNTLRTFLQ